MWKDAIWLGIPASVIRKSEIFEGDMSGRFAYFRHKFIVEEKVELTILISANSRYRLWVNGKPVLSGPCKGDAHRCFYEEVSLTEYLNLGQNVLAVQVLYTSPFSAVYQEDERASIYSVVTPGGGHRLAIEGVIRSSTGHVIGNVTTGKADWRVYLEGSFYLKSQKITEYLGAVCEEIDFSSIPKDWKEVEYNDEIFSTPSRLDTVLVNDYMKSVGLVQRFPMKKRTIPLLYEKPDVFLNGSLVEVKAGERRTVVLDAGVIKNGYPRYEFQKGKTGRVSFTYYERVIHKSKEIRRDDLENGDIVGVTDTIVLGEGRNCYEPFWPRTFRFLRIQIEAREEDVIMKVPTFRKTGYPIRAATWVESSETWVQEVWEICVRTLENCMLETYMDCPYYEQLQFSMDTRLQAMFTYVISDDTRLAKKALEDFHYSMIPEGLIQGKYPSVYPQIISTFSLHYIFMIYEYFVQTDDFESIKKYAPDVDRILAYYDSKIDNQGLVGRLGYWEFVDWQKEWEEYRGAPAALTKGPSTIINLMYGYALLIGVKIYEVVGRSSIASEYRRRQLKITSNIQSLCWDEERQMYREGPEFKQFSWHAQAWAVLNNMLNKEKSASLLLRAMAQDDVIRCSFSTAYEWFRAMEKSGLYEKTKYMMDKWAALPLMGATTCPEEPENGRSDCHAWSALPMYEFVRGLAGVECDQPGWKRVKISPHLSYLPDLHGEINTPKGIISFSYYKQKEGSGARGKNVYKVKLPQGLEGIFIYRDEKTKKLIGGKEYCLYEQE